MTTRLRIAIVYHSGYGHTARQAWAVKMGVEQVEGFEVLLLTVEEAQQRWDDLARAEAIISAPRLMWRACPQRSKSSRKRRPMP